MVRYSIEIGQQEQDILKEIVLASDKNVKKRKFATGLSSVMAVIMLIYTILCFMNSRIGYGIIGLLFSVFFIWIIINGANTFQKKVINIVHSKMDNKLTSENVNIVLIPMELQLVLILVTGLIIGTPLNVGGFSEITYISEQ